MRIFSAEILLMLLIFSASGASSQTLYLPFDSVYSGNFLRTNFSNDINTSSLNSVLNFTTIKGNVGVTVSEFFQSNVSKLQKNFSRDFNNFNGIVFYSLSPQFSAGAGFQNIFLNDDKDIETDRNNSSFIFSNFDYAPHPSLSANLRLGFEKEDQIGEVNSGFSGIFNANADNFYVKDYKSNGYLIMAYEDLQGKKSHNFDINANVFKRFSLSADNTGSLRFYNISNDFYFPASQSVAQEFNIRNNTERRSENFVSVGDALNYRLNEFSGVTLAGSYYNRLVTREFKYRATSSNALLENLYDSKVVEDFLELSAGADVSYKSIYGLAKMFYIERAENHSLINISGLTPQQVSELEKAEKNKNNNSRRTGLLGELKYRFSNTNFLSAVGSASLLRYDTDLEENYDDRDELEYNFYLLHGYNNLRNFDIQTKFDYIESDLSYIFSQRSANNYKNRIYRLSSLSNFAPVENIVTRNFVQVLANYTVYDFEDIVSQVQSFSYRQLLIRDSTSYAFHPNFEFLFNGELRFYEQGQFNNDDFSVKPISYFEEQFYSPELACVPVSLLRLSAGFRYFKQVRYRYEDAEKQTSGVYRSYGPFGKIFLYLNNGSIVNFTGGIDFISNTLGGSDDESLNLLLALQWNI